MENTLLGVGIACILAAIVGGGFKGLGVEIPAIKTGRRQAALATAGVVLILAVQFTRWRERENAVDPAALVKSGLEAYDAGEFGAAAAQFREAAERGEREAQYHYGEMLYHGEGLVPDKQAAIQWIRKSANQGFAPAEASAAMAAEEESPSDTAAARMWAERSANQNDPVGLYVLAGLVTDSTERMNLILRSAEQGYAPSQLYLGLALANRGVGAGRAVGMLDGLQWMRRAANQGDQAAQLTMARNALMLGRDSSMAGTAYLWWTLAQQAHARPFAAPPELMAMVPVIGAEIEARLSVRDQLEARRQANDEPYWRPKPERPYRHGH